MKLYSLGKIRGTSARWEQARGARSLYQHYLFKDKDLLLNDLQENKRFMDIEPTMATWPWGGEVAINFVSKFIQNRF